MGIPMGDSMRMHAPKNGQAGFLPGDPVWRRDRLLLSGLHILCHETNRAAVLGEMCEEEGRHAKSVQHSVHGSLVRVPDLDEDGCRAKIAMLHDFQPARLDGLDSDEVCVIDHPGVPAAHLIQFIKVAVALTSIVGLALGKTTCPIVLVERNRKLKFCSPGRRRGTKLYLCHERRGWHLVTFHCLDGHRMLVEGKD